MNETQKIVLKTKEALSLSNKMRKRLRIARKELKELLDVGLPIDPIWQKKQINARESEIAHLEKILAEQKEKGE
jgi:hypothetical protein